MEKGLRFTREADESSINFQIIKDSAVPNFSSRETESRFILTARLKGYRIRNVSIEINEDGTLIAIRCERRVKETTMTGHKLYKKEIEVKGFKKLFKIPDGVVLDGIEAKFDEDESILTVTMPKVVTGIRGNTIEEIEEVVDEEIRATTNSSGDLRTENDELVSSDPKGGGNVSRQREEESNGNNEGPRIYEPPLPNRESVYRDESFKICTPIIAGSAALILSFVAFIVHVVKNRKQTTRARG